MSFAYSEVVEANVGKSAHSEVKVQRGEDVEELEWDDGGEATPHTDHAVVT